MIYDLDHGYLFLHIPRTAGTSIEWGLAEHCPAAVAHVFEERHVWARGLRPKFPELRRRKLRRFAVIRSPWDTIASQYRHIIGAASRITWRTRLECAPGWIAEMRRVAAYGSFRRFVEEDYLRAPRYLRLGGFWATWCEGGLGETLDVEPIRFDRLAHEWPRICDELRIPRFVLPYRNRSEGEPVTWPADLVERIGELCYHDVTLFGFDPPEAAA
jgi:hypothetical protein